MNIAGERAIISSNRYNGLLKKQNNTANIVEEQAVSAKDNSLPAHALRHEQSNDMQAHFGAIRSMEQSCVIREPDIKILTDKVKEVFSNSKIAANGSEIAASNINTTDGNNSMSSEQLINSFVDSYLKSYEQYLSVFAGRKMV